ncbi:MAG: DUF2062 domain-containing protein [Marinilabiliaceae bacterium]|nr:DUF2062 domain-containing protein [Marinilabiliaceae bacterium]
MNADFTSEFDQIKCCVIIPTYNNDKTLLDVIDDVKRYTSNIIVVNDGSTDSTVNILSGIEDITVVGYEKNKGKGYAIRKGFKHALYMGYHYAITIDSDGQHYANDLPVFIDEIKNNPNSLLIGSRFMEGQDQPGISSFANKFSNFWFGVETGIKLADTQSGYRLYPIKILESKKWFCSKYEFEIEIVVRAAWQGMPVVNVPVHVFYPDRDERVSHFRPFNDFFRISVLNTILVFLAFVFYRPYMIIRKNKGKSIKEIFTTHILNGGESNTKIAAAIGFGVFMGIFPIWGYQLLVGFSLAHFFKLNKAIFFVAANISLPPMIPFVLYLSYVTGSFLLGEGSFVVDTELSITSITTNVKQYLIGAVALSLFAGFLFYLLSYFLLILFRKR